MKKKILLGIGGGIVVIAIAVMLIFVLSGSVEPSGEALSLDGTWRVVAQFNNGTPALTDNMFMVFGGGTGSVYVGDTSKPYAASKYTLDAATMTLDLPEIGRKYTVEWKTGEHVRLYESKEVYMYLVKSSVADLSKISDDTSLLSGKWEVVYRDAAQMVEEYMVFEDGKMSDYRNGAGDPSVVSDYTWNGRQITLSAINKTMVLNVIDKDTVALVETDSGLLWELKKK